MLLLTFSIFQKIPTEPEERERVAGDRRRDQRRETGGRLLRRLQRQRGWLNHRNQGPPHMVAGFMDFSNQATLGCGSPATTWGSSDESGAPVKTVRYHFR
ncbi:hypothetical protein Hanom_Chr16g01470381 [Helianthus anomalus]